MRRVKLLGWTGDGGGGFDDRNDDGGGGPGLLRLTICDFVLSFLWVCTLAAISIVFEDAWFWSTAMYVAAWFLFVWLGVATEVGFLDPQSSLAAFLADESQGVVDTFLFRVPSQVAGYVLGVKLITRTMPELQGGPQLNVSAIVGVVIEGSFSFVAVIVYRLLKETGQGFFTETFVSSIARLALHGFGKASTGGWINPGYAFGWAYAKGAHTSLEHLLVYWLAPFASTLFGSWAFDHVVHPEKHGRRPRRAVIGWKSN